MNNLIIATTQFQNIQLQNEIKKDRTTVEIFIGPEITANFTENEITAFAIQYSIALSMHKKTMLQMKASEIVSLISEGLVVFVCDSKRKTRLLAAARLLAHSNKTFELCSWYAFTPGYGKFVIDPIKLLSKSFNKHSSLFALTETENIHAQISLLKRGAKLLSQKPAELHLYLTDEAGNQAKVKYFLFE